MKEDNSIIRLRQPGSVEDPLTEIAREGARRMLVTALEAEIEAFLEGFVEERLADGRQRVVRHGHGPERKVQTGIGALALAMTKSVLHIESHLLVGDGSARHDRISVWTQRSPSYRPAAASTHAHLPGRRARRCPSAYGRATPALRLRDSGQLACRCRTRWLSPITNLSPGVISRLTAEWEAEYERWQHRDLSARRYVYVWADGVYLQARMEPEAECILVVIGATPEGKKELVGFYVGRRESAQSWRELLVELRARGLAAGPEVAVGDGALGFWKALDEVFPGTRHQRCWVHKTSNVLNKFPKSMAPTVKSDLRDIWQAETRDDAETAMDVFAEKYGAKYGGAVTCLTKDHEALLAFFDYPAEHWDHLRTANPIESVFATVRHRTVRTKGALSQKTAKLMVFTLVHAASKKWRRLMGANQLPLVVDGIRFIDGVAPSDAENRAA